MPSEIQTTRASSRPKLPQTLTANWRPRLLGAVVATLACTLIWLAGGAAGASFVVSFGDEHASMDVTIWAVIGSVLAAAVAGWVLLVVLELFTVRARTVWTVLALTAAAISTLPAFGYEADTETKLSLAFMHVAAAAVIIPLFRPVGVVPQQERPTSSRERPTRTPAPCRARSVRLVLAELALEAVLSKGGDRTGS